MIVDADDFLGDTLGPIIGKQVEYDGSFSYHPE